MTANVENPPLNRDIQLIVDRVTDIPAPAAAPEEASSATSLLLGQFGSARVH